MLRRLDIILGSVLVLLSSGCSAFGAAEPSSNGVGSASDAGTPSGDAAPPDTGVDSNDLLSVISPSTAKSELTGAREMNWTIATLDPTLSLTYSAIGPTAQMNGTATGKLLLPNLPTDTTLTWRVGSGPEHKFKVLVDTAARSKHGFIVEETQFDTTQKPIVTAAPASAIKGSLKYQHWINSETCPDCIQQIAIGITTPLVCLDSRIPGGYPGYGDERPFLIKAPSERGTYKLRVGRYLQLSCDDALKQPNLGDVEIATIIVE